MNRNSEPGTYIIHFFVCLALYRHATHLDAKKTREALAYGRDMGPKLRSLADGRYIDIHDTPARRRNLVDDTFEKLGRVSPAPFLVRIRKVRADVAERRGAQERVYHSVNNNICIGVALETRFASNLDATQHKPAPRLEAVRIVAEPYT